MTPEEQEARWYENYRFAFWHMGQDQFLLYTIEHGEVSLVSRETLMETIRALAKETT